MTKGKFIAVILIFLMIWGVLAGCSHWKYHATLYDAAGAWIKEDFQKENIVHLEGGSTYPKNRVFIVNTQVDYDQIFIPDAAELSVDFDTQMLIVYTFTDTNRRNKQIVGMNLNDSVLKITYQKEKPIKEYFVPVGDTCNPYQQWFVVKMDKLPVDSVVFEKK